MHAPLLQLKAGVLTWEIWLLCAVGDELKEAIKRQVEFYFSKTNLATDAFLVSHMNSQMYV